MDRINNTILTAYAQHFDELSITGQFHFASRLYLWNQPQQAKAWLDGLRAVFSANDQPLEAARRLLEQPLPALAQTGLARLPFFDRYPKLRLYERVLFRLVFLHTVYGLGTRDVLCQVFPEAELREQRDALLADHQALTGLSSFAVNYLYLLDRFIFQDETSLPVERFLELGQGSFDTTDRLERQLRCYYYTHCIISESLFYARSVPAANRDSYLQMLAEVERILNDYFDEVKLDIKYEFLVCCRLLGTKSPLEDRILGEAGRWLSLDGYLVEPRPMSGQPGPTLQNSEHRNVLFLLCQRPFRPLF